VARQASSAGYEVSALVRTASKLPADIAEAVVVHEADLLEMSSSRLAALLGEHDAVVNTAGFVTDGQRFVDLVDRIVSGLESLPSARSPVCWFMAGAALLDLDARGRLGVDLPRIASTYWPHRANFDRLRHTELDWRILCPGPLVERPPLGLARMRISVDRLPVHAPAFHRFLPGVLALPFFVRRVPEMIVSYADVAALMLANLTPWGEMSRHRVGLALPVGMRGKKERWTARPHGSRPQNGVKAGAASSPSPMGDAPATSRKSGG
jgi:putative NADH-flavin reductase